MAETHPLQIGFNVFDQEVKRTLSILETNLKNVQSVPKVEGQDKVPKPPFNPLRPL